MIIKYFEKIWDEAYSQNDKNIISLLEQNPRAKVLDVGCGDGKKTIKFKTKINTQTIIGVDGVKKRLSAAKRYGVDKVLLTNLEHKWNIRDKSFDVIISNQVIEHVANTDNFIQEINRILKPGGYIVISTENLASWHNIFALILGLQDFSHHIIMKCHIGNPFSPHYKEKTLTWSKKANSGVDDTAFPHLKVPTYYSLIKAFEAYGFKLVKGVASGYYPLSGFLSKLFSKFDPYHSHFITVKFTKNRKNNS